MKTSIFAVCLLVITAAAEKPLCSVKLPGCGEFADGKPCTCIGNMDEDSSQSLGAYCARKDSRSLPCCPCAETAGLFSGSSDSSDSSEELPGCASQSNLDELDRLLELVRTISGEAVETCGTPLTEECAGERVFLNLGCELSELRFVAEDIAIDCVGPAP